MLKCPFFISLPLLFALLILSLKTIVMFPLLFQALLILLCEFAVLLFKNVELISNKFLSMSAFLKIKRKLVLFKLQLV
jgi:hypothetical protein